MNQAIGTVWNVVSGIIAQIGVTRKGVTNSMKIEHDAVYVQESDISIQPQVMAGATFLLIVILVVIIGRK